MTNVENLNVNKNILHKKFTFRGTLIYYLPHDSLHITFIFPSILLKIKILQFRKKYL